MRSLLILLGLTVLLQTPPAPPAQTPAAVLADARAKMTANDLMQVYQREAEKQRLLVKKSDFTQTRLLFIVEAMKDLLADEGFVTLLRAECLETMPRALALRIAGDDDD